MSRTLEELESLAGIAINEEFVESSLNEGSDLERIKKGLVHSLKKNDMKTVSKVAKEVLAAGGQSDFDEIIDFIVQMSK